jgi:hypothetical protein
MKISHFAITDNMKIAFCDSYYINEPALLISITSIYAFSFAEGSSCNEASAVFSI